MLNSTLSRLLMQLGYDDIRDCHVAHFKAVAHLRVASKLLHNEVRLVRSAVQSLRFAVLCFLR